MRGSSKWHFVPLQYMFYITFQPKLSNCKLGKSFCPCKNLGNGNVLHLYLLNYKYELDIDSKKGMISISSKHKFEQYCVFLSFC